MKRSITRWTTTLATAALLGLPVAAAAKTQQPPAPPQQQEPAPQPQQPQPSPQQPTPTPQPTASAAQPSAQSESPEEHLRQAHAAFDDIKMTSIPARNRAEFAELRRHLAALDNPSAPAASSRSSRGTAASASNWGTEVAAIDRLITHLAGSDTATGTSDAATTAATGTAGTSGSRGASNVAVDEATRAKLMEIRTHITAYAAAKSGASSSPRSDAPTMASETMTSTAQSGNATPSAQSNTGSTAGAQAGTTDAQAGVTGTAKVDTEAAHRSLLAARDTLNQLTQLPAATQLTGESRTQVQQLIASFNELVTNTNDWRPSYAKVSASLTMLLGPDNIDAEATGGTPTTTTGAAGTAGTVGTVGTGGGATVPLDPEIRAKLVEMRNNLNEFQKASGGLSK